ncbi:MAG: hypothetical protein WAJ85_11790 [Candidatus Baltobacteraceae bacterium]
MGRVGRRLAESTPFLRGQLAFKVLHEPDEHAPLPVGERDAFVQSPEGLRLQDVAGHRARRVNRANVALEKPDRPIRDVEVPLLRSLERVIVGALLRIDLTRHAEIAPARPFIARERHVGDGAGDPAVPIGVGVDRQEPEMRGRAAQEAVLAARGFEPPQERLHLSRDALGGRRLEVHRGLVDAAGDDLHRAGRVVPPARGRGRRFPTP